MPCLPSILVPVIGAALILASGFVAFRACNPRGVYADAGLHLERWIMPVGLFCFGIFLLFRPALPAPLVTILEWLPHRDTKLHPLVFLALVGGGVSVVLLFSSYYWRRRLNRWAIRHNFELIEYKGLPCWKGPWAFTQSEYQTDFFIKVRESDGKIREGHVCFGDYWGFSPADAEVVWSDANFEIDAIIEEASRQRAEIRRTKDPNDLLKPRW